VTPATRPMNKIKRAFICFVKHPGAAASTQ
jgi:hypothetical protein